jgi:hypothetical protein
MRSHESAIRARRAHRRRQALTACARRSGGSFISLLAARATAVSSAQEGQEQKSSK